MGIGSSKWQQVLGGTLLVLCLASAGHAQPYEGSQEVQGGGSFFHAIGSGAGTFNADVAYGYFPTPLVEVGLRQGYNLSQNDGPGDVWNATTTPFIDFHFTDLWDRNYLVPFAGGFVGLVWNDQDLTGTVGPEAGLKAYLSTDSFISARYRYEWFFDELESVQTTQDANHVVGIALGYTWGGRNVERAQRG